jgi:hypothetical protein
MDRTCFHQVLKSLIYQSLRQCILVEPIYSILVRVCARRVLSGIDLLIVEELDEAVKSSSYNGTEEGTDPVDPMVGRKFSGGDSRAETTSRVK